MFLWTWFNRFTYFFFFYSLMTYIIIILYWHTLLLLRKTVRTDVLCHFSLSDYHLILFGVLWTQSRMYKSILSHQSIKSGEVVGCFLHNYPKNSGDMVPFCMASTVLASLNSKICRASELNLSTYSLRDSFLLCQTVSR